MCCTLHLLDPIILTREEVPHSIAVTTDSMKRDEETGKIHIMATIIVERKSQKGIILGKGGDMIRKIGKLARRDIELMLGDKVYLETWVKIKMTGATVRWIYPTLVTRKKIICKSWLV